jgi:signal transduction histidine kinase
LWQTNSIALKYLGGSLSLLAGLTSAILLIGYLYNAPLLYGSTIIPVSLPSVICFLLFSITLYRHYELKYWTFNLVKENKVSLQLLRSFLPIVVFVVIFQGVLDTVYSFNHINPPLTAAFILLIVITLTVVVIIRVSGNLGHKIQQAEQELKDSEERLKQLNIDKDRFISILGHDLRSPFNAILGLSEILKDEVLHSSIDEIEEFANHIHKSAQSLYELVDDLLTWTKAQSGKIPFEPGNLNCKEVCSEVLEIHREIAASKNITIDCTVKGDISVFADLDMLKTVLRNLVSNAIKFTYAGGTIRIKALEQSGLVSIYVSDNGIGISPHTLSRLFDPSQNISTVGTEKETGTGLGLLLCKEFVEKHGGRIWVESEVGKGSDFVFTLPKPLNIENDHKIGS